MSVHITYFIPIHSVVPRCGLQLITFRTVINVVNYLFGDCYRVESDIHITRTTSTGPEPMVRPVRFWPDHFLLGVCPLLVNAWDWHLQQNHLN